MTDLHFEYEPIEDLEQDEKFKQALLVVQEFLKPNGLILLRFLMNRAYFVGYNQGYDDGDFNADRNEQSLINKTRGQ